MDEHTPASETPIRYAAATDTGLRRPHNEDAHGEEPDLGLFVVADGMGGHEAGEVASRIVVDHVIEAVRGGGALGEATAAAHNAVVEAVGEGRGREGMGATVVALRLDGDRYEIAWAGDSRAYSFGGVLQRLTRDHSVVQELVDVGALSEQEARNHPERSLVTRAMGMPESREMPVDTLRGRLRAGERLLLCSDGLTEELTDADIERILQEGGSDLRAVARNLVDAALAAGGRDNITVLLVEAPENVAGRGSPARLALAAALGLGAALLASWLLGLAGVAPFG